MTKILIASIFTILISAGLCRLDRQGCGTYSKAKRSHCFHCGRVLRAWQLIPILSALILRGRCFFCRTKYGWRYFYWELSGFLLAYCLGTDSSGLLTAFVLLLASYQDWQNGEVDIWPLWALFFWQAWHNWSQFEPLLVLGIFCLSLYFIYVRKALGAGDLPVLLLLGLGTVVQFASATLAAACSALIYIYLSKRPAIPFIPFLTLGYFCSYLCQ